MKPILHGNKTVRTKGLQRSIISCLAHIKDRPHVSALANYPSALYFVFLLLWHCYISSRTVLGDKLKPRLKFWLFLPLEEEGGIKLSRMNRGFSRE